MYEKFNAALRFFSSEPTHARRSDIPHHQLRCESELSMGVWLDESSGGVKWEWHNNYCTTIHAINSCVLKLSKLTVACKVWRGFTGAALPPSFFEANAEGIKGGIEYVPLGFQLVSCRRAATLRII